MRNPVNHAFTITHKLMNHDIDQYCPRAGSLVSVVRFYRTFSVWILSLSEWAYDELKKKHSKTKHGDPGRCCELCCVIACSYTTTEPPGSRGIAKNRTFPDQIVHSIFFLSFFFLLFFLSSLVCLLISFPQLLAQSANYFLFASPRRLLSK